MQTIDGELVIISGDSRSGKTAKAVQEMRKHSRVIVWDVDAQWCELLGYKTIRGRAALRAAVMGLSGPARIAFVPMGNDLKADFQFWADCVLYWGTYKGPCAAVPEELADVTSSGKASGNWGILCRRGLKRGISLYPISQRWSEADKTAFGNATRYLCFMQATDDDAAYMASKLRIDRAEINNLGRLEYIELIKETRELTRHKLTFAKNRK